MQQSPSTGGAVSGRPAALPGTAALVLALAGGRWGNYLTIGVPPIPGGVGLSSGPPYLLDVLVLLAVVRITFNGRQRLPRLSVPAVLAALLWLYVVVRFLLADSLSFVAVRDFAPYAYVILVPLMALATANASIGSLQRTASWVYGALIFHAAWVATTLIAPSVFADAPLLRSAPSVRMFDLRSDFDAACCAALTGIAAFLILKGRSGATGRHMLVAALGLFTVAGIHSRVGLLALALLAPLVALALAHSRRAVLSICASIPALILLAAVAVPNSTAGQRLLLQQVSPSNAQAGASAAGTTEARQRAWEAVYRYTGRDAKRALIGVGFGPDFMIASGGLTKLVGQDRREEVRSPHNFVVGTYARLGVVGIAMFAGLLAPVFTRLRRSLRRDRGGLESQSAILLVSLAVASVVGVILESPFGAIPFYVSAGVLVGLAYRSEALDGGTELPIKQERGVSRT